MNNLVYHLLNLKQYLISYHFFYFLFFLILLLGWPTDRPRPAHRPGTGLNRPASWPAQTGHQAGSVPEAAGLPAGPNRSPGRASARGCRPPGRPGRFPGRHIPTVAATDGGETRGRGGKRERKERGMMTSGLPVSRSRGRRGEGRTNDSAAVRGWRWPEA